MRKIHRNFAVIMVLFLTFSFYVGNAYASWAGQSDWMEDVVLPGVLNPYKDLVLRGPKSCQAACLKDPTCGGWTYVKPGFTVYGVQGPRCLLMKDFRDDQYYSEGAISGMKQCAKLSFISTSPIPSVVIGGNYNYKIQTSGGYKTVELCPVAIDPRGRPSIKCDKSPVQRFSMPPGLTMDKSGVISGQVKCWDPSRPFSCAGYQSILVKARDSCPIRPQIITKEYFIDVKAKP